MKAKQIEIDLATVWKRPPNLQGHTVDVSGVLRVEELIPIRQDLVEWLSLYLRLMH